MSANVYTFKITYEGIDNKIWRTIEVSSRYLLPRLGYCILASFDTLAEHLFFFKIGKNLFLMPDKYRRPASNRFDMADFKLEDLKLNIGDKFNFFYDFGTTQEFTLELLSVSPMKRGTGTHYPFVLEGEGRGIIDNQPSEEVKKLIDEIDKFGKTKDDIYYKIDTKPWDYKDYSLKYDNCLLKGEIDVMEEDYIHFWIG